MGRRWLGLLVVGVLWTWSTAAHAGKPVALVIGNGSYAHTSNLEQAPADARAVGSPVADPLVNQEPSESIEVRFVPFRTARRELGMPTPDSWGHIVADAPIDGTRRLAAVRDTRLLPPEDFAILVGDPARARKVRNLSRISRSLLGIQLGILLGGIVLGTQEGTQTVGTTLAVSSLAVGTTGLIVLHQRARAARYDLDEAEAAVRDAGGVVLDAEVPEANPGR